MSTLPPKKENTILMVKRTLALEAATEMAEKISGKSSEGCTAGERKRKYEVENASRPQQSTKKVERMVTEVKDVCHYCHLRGHKEENYWKKLGACLCCGSDQHRLSNYPLLPKELDFEEFTFFLLHCTYQTIGGELKEQPKRGQVSKAEKNSFLPTPQH
ncbi:hypothetical protein Taro_037167 [Colocasia esculenta]|uniref:Uncharacterized protein n=1 Tax=Colocasia esculenta TaxID=4460 RepID=A0A843WNW1_COLES|nr:hypothetical protein [Colocasia esculenta]